MGMFLPSAWAAADKKLPLCGASANCVSSQAQLIDKQHFITPFEIKGQPQQAWAALKAAITNQPRLVITHQSPNRLHTEATSLVSRYVDDIDAVLDAGQELIHIRSASRENHDDFGVHRRRIETLRNQLRQAGVLE